MNAIIKDMKEAWVISKKFLSNEDDSHLCLKVDSEYSNEIYTIIKLPYGENIYLLYAVRGYTNAPLIPGSDLKYVGFYSRKHKQSYLIREPLTAFFEFDGKHVYEGTLKKEVIKAVQTTVAEYISSRADEFSELTFDDINDEIIRDAEIAFSKKEIVHDFASKIEVSDWRISETSMIQYIDNPNNVHNPDSALKRYVDDIIRGHEEKMARLWYAHCKSQLLLDRLNAESAGGDSNAQN